MGRRGADQGGLVQGPGSNHLCDGAHGLLLRRDLVLLCVGIDLLQLAQEHTASVSEVSWDTYPLYPPTTSPPTISPDNPPIGQNPRIPRQRPSPKHTDARARARRRRRQHNCERRRRQAAEPTLSSRKAMSFKSCFARTSHFFCRASRSLLMFANSLRAAFRLRSVVVGRGFALVSSHGLTFCHRSSATCTPPQRPQRVSFSAQPSRRPHCPHLPAAAAPEDPAA